jgi:hypothetical protein
MAKKLKWSKENKKLVKANHSAYLYNCMREDIQFDGDSYMCGLVEVVASSIMRLCDKHPNWDAEMIKSEIGRLYME